MLITWINALPNIIIIKNTNTGFHSFNTINLWIAPIFFTIKDLITDLNKHLQYKIHKQFQENLWFLDCDDCCQCNSVTSSAYYKWQNKFHRIPRWFEKVIDV